MKSKTKYNLSENEIKQIFQSNNITNIIEIKPLGNGMFNAVYNVATQNREYVLKVAPKQSQKVMTYETDMLQAELYWYDMINKKTDVATPKIFFSAPKNNNIIDADYFAMEKINGCHRNKAKLSPKQKLETTVEILAEFHNVKNTEYGYIQNRLYDNWYEALSSMIINIINDTEKTGKTTANGEKLLKYVELYKDILKSCECTMVNYDLWDTNLIYDGNKFTVIDPERTFWGDPVFDFMCVQGFTKPLSSKKQAIDLYNLKSYTEITINRESEIRYAFAQGYMALIQEIEKYYRFAPLSEGWLFDNLSSKILYKLAFKVLENER